MRCLIAFDLDGTLVDSRLDLAASANALLQEHGAAPLAVDQVASMVGEGARVLVSRVLAAAHVDVDVSQALERFLEIYDSHLVDHTRLYPGVLEALRALEGHATLTILTNKPGRHTERLLDFLRVRHFFSTVIGGDGPVPRKPDPAGLRHLIAESGATARTTLMVGDSMVDVETARQAPARICVARYGFGQLAPSDLLGADVLVAAEPSDLEPVLLDFVATAR